MSYIENLYGQTIIFLDIFVEYSLYKEDLSILNYIVIHRSRNIKTEPNNGDLNCGSVVPRTVSFRNAPVQYIN